MKFIAVFKTGNSFFGYHSSWGNLVGEITGIW